jgi:hypothetical protein
MSTVAEGIDWIERAIKICEGPVNKPSQGFYVVPPELASEWLSTMNYKHQRKIRTYHVTGLAREMEAGRFRANTQVNFCELRGQFHLTNGQHTLAAIIKSGVPQQLCVVVTRVKSEQEIADDFSRHDTHLTRRMADSLAAHEVHLHLGVTPTELQLLTAACVYFASGVNEISARNMSAVTHDEKLNIVMKHGELAVKCVRLLEGRLNKNYLTRKTTLAPMMFTLSHDASIEFWEGVRDDDGLRVGDPRKTLLEYLRTSVTIGSRTDSRALLAKATSAHALVKGIAVSWNAWVARRDLKIIRVQSMAATEAVFDQIGPFRC